MAAQGIAASTASGVHVSGGGAWTKRFHPGSGAVAGITAATLAGSGFHGPRRPYEGRFGLLHAYRRIMPPVRRQTGLDRNSASVGILRILRSKPYPVCHFIHGALQAAILLNAEIGNSRFVSVGAYLPEKTLPIIAEPSSSKNTRR